jgi:PAS domain S-box-containing protein
MSNDLDEKIALVLDSLIPETEEIESENGCFFVRKVLPFITGDNRINGVVITFFEITEIKKSEIALRKSEEKLKESNLLLSAVLSHTHILTATLDTEFNYIWVNKSFAENLGQAGEFFVKKNHFILYPNAENKAIFQKVVDTKEAAYLTAKPFVFHAQPERGLTYWDWSLIPVKNDQDKITSLVFTLVEVTNKVKAEIAFRQESKLKESLLASINDGFFSLDKNLKITYYNKAAARLLKRSSKQVLGKYVFDAFPEARGSIFAEKYKQALEEQKSFEFEIYFEVKPIDNWYQVKITPFEEGLSVFFVVTTEQKKSQQLLIEQSQALKQAQQIAQIGTWKWNKETDEMSCSEEMLSIFGLEKTEMPITAEKIATEFAHPEDREKVNEVFAKTRSGNDFLAFEFKIVRPDRQTKTLWIEACSSQRKDANATTISGIVHDITDRKRIELERLRLEKFASKSQKIEALGTLAGGIAHNFNNFLCGVFGNIELAMDENDKARRKRFLSNAMKSMETAKALTRQLVTFARGGDPEKQQGDIWSTVKDAANFALAGANLSLKVVEPGPLWQCSYDRGQISQVINNIVINSRQAMPDGGEITLKAQNVNIEHTQINNLHSGKYVKISVSDNGPGIPEKYAAKVFDPFFSTKVTNQGLGLAISYSIVAKHGGILALQSHSQACTCFDIFLPAQSECSRNEQAPEAFMFSRQENYSGKILIMDDEEMVREILSEMLNSLGFETYCTKDGQEAVQELVQNRNNYKAGILDLTVPGKMGGKEACEILRDSGIRIPLYAASGYSSDPIITNPDDFGFDGSITKPFTLDDLCKTMQ